MPNKTKTTKIQQRLADVAAQSGVLLMATAATIGMLPVPEHPERRVVALHQPSFVFATPSVDTGTHDSSMRKEREEVHSHNHGYSISQRTPARAGRA